MAPTNSTWFASDRFVQYRRTWDGTLQERSELEALWAKTSVGGGWKDPDLGRCVRCGDIHSVDSYDEKGMCTKGAKDYREKLHKVFWSQLKRKY